MSSRNPEREDEFMEHNRQNDTTSPPPANPAGGSSATNPDSSTPTPNQILQESWAASVDSQTALQFTGLSQVRQARTNQLQREVTSLTKTYGPNDPGVIAVQTSLQFQQT